MKYPTGLLAAALCLSGIAHADEQVPHYDFSGPYKAEVVRVIDGDTIVVRVKLWPNITAEVAARVRGVDTPEISNPGCESEMLLGEEARRFVEKRYPPGDMVELRDVGPDSFFGRVVADIRRWRSDRWLPLATELLEADPALAVEWTPAQNPVPWCLLTKAP